MLTYAQTLRTSREVLSERESERRMVPTSTHGGEEGR